MTAGDALPACNALWIGPVLGAIEQACLRSFIEAGHRVNLFTYDEVAGVPRGVDVVDASAILPRAAIVRHRKSGSVSLFSNRFRYALLKAGRGLWIDCDMLCLRPIAAAPYVFGFQGSTLINGAILKLPHDHPVLDDLLGIFTTRSWIPPWLRSRRKAEYWLRYRVQWRFGIADMPWGVAGPRALTHYLVRHGLGDRAQPIDAFYPLAWHESEMLTGPDRAAVVARVTPRTQCIHLWNQSRSERRAVPVAGSFLAAVADGEWRRLLPDLVA